MPGSFVQVFGMIERSGSRGLLPVRLPYVGFRHGEIVLGDLMNLKVKSSYCGPRHYASIISTVLSRSARGSARVARWLPSRGFHFESGSARGQISPNTFRYRSTHSWSQGKLH